MKTAFLKFWYHLTYFVLAKNGSNHHWCNHFFFQKGRENEWAFIQELSLKHLSQLLEEKIFLFLRHSSRWFQNNLDCHTLLIMYICVGWCIFICDRVEYINIFYAKNNKQRCLMHRVQQQYFRWFSVLLQDYPRLSSRTELFLNQHLLLIYKDKMVVELGSNGDSLNENNERRNILLVQNNFCLNFWD